MRRRPQKSFVPIVSTTIGNVLSRSVARAFANSSITEENPAEGEPVAPPILTHVTAPAIEESLDRAEIAVAAGEGLAGTGFWAAVAELKREPDLVETYADRVAAIDEAAFRNWALLTIPIGAGTILAVVAVLIGLALVGWAYGLEGLVAVVVFYSGFVALLAATHGLGHLLVGWSMGMRFTCWFVGEMARPQPGVKVDYSTYLRTRPTQRAWMHASGAIVTKALPFLLIGAAVAADLPAWAVWLLPVIGVVTILTDVVWSTKSSDWKKYRREMAFVQDS